jgi:hypothetical protein
MTTAHSAAATMCTVSAAGFQYSELFLCFTVLLGRARLNSRHTMGTVISLDDAASKKCITQAPQDGEQYGQYGHTSVGQVGAHLLLLRDDERGFPFRGGPCLLHLGRFDRGRSVDDRLVRAPPLVAPTRIGLPLPKIATLRHIHDDDE